MQLKIREMMKPNCCKHNTYAQQANIHYACIDKSLGLINYSLMNFDVGKHSYTGRTFLRQSRTKIMRIFRKIAFSH